MEQDGGRAGVQGAARNKMAVVLGCKGSLEQDGSCAGEQGAAWNKMVAVLGIEGQHRASRRIKLS